MTETGASLALVEILPDEERSVKPSGKNPRERIAPVRDADRQNPAIDVETVITQLGVGEALVSFLDEKGHPGVVERAFILLPGGRIGLITPDERQSVIRGFLVYGHDERAVDRESAYEMLRARAERETAEEETRASRQARIPDWRAPYPSETRYPKVPQPSSGRPMGARRAPGRPRDTLLESMAKSAARSAGSQLGRSILRGIPGSILGGGRR